jgi:hypothetical protein
MVLRMVEVQTTDRNESTFKNELLTPCTSRLRYPSENEATRFEI